MDMYEAEKELKLEKQVGLTKEVYELLRKEKGKQKISMAKIVCNLIIKEYGMGMSKGSRAEQK